MASGAFGHPAPPELQKSKAVGHLFSGEPGVPTPGPPRLLVENKGQAGTVADGDIPTLLITQPRGSRTCWRCAVGAQHPLLPAQPCSGSSGSSCPRQPISTTNPLLPAAADSSPAWENDRKVRRAPWVPTGLCVLREKAAEFPFFLGKGISAFVLWC